MKSSLLFLLATVLLGELKCRTAPFPPPSAASDSKTLDGVVVDAEGKEVSDARVSLVAGGSRPSTVVNVVQTDARGRFHFVFADSADDEIYWDVLVEAPGFALTPAHVLMAGEQRVVLGKACDAEVMLTDEGGSPLPGIRIRPDKLISETAIFAFRYPANLAERFAQTSDAQGVCSFKGLPGHVRLRMTVEDERFAQLAYEDDISIRENPAARTRTLILIPAATLKGTAVYGTTGKPAAGVRIGAQGASGRHGWAEAITDAAGGYTLKQMRPGLYNVALDLRSKWGEAWTARAHEKVVVASRAELTEFNFKLIEGVTIRGIVCDEKSGEPLPGVSVGVYGPAHPRSSAWVQATKSGKDGTYLLRVPPGEQHVYLQSSPPPGYDEPDLRAQDITIKESEAVTFDLKLPRK